MEKNIKKSLKAIINTMFKKYKAIINNLLLFDIIYTIIFIFVNIFIYLIGLMFREWFLFLNYFIIGALGIIGLYQLILKMNNYLIKTILCYIYTLSLFFIIPLVLLIPIFFYTPDHVVVKDNHKMVAYVKSFLRVNVNYYEYKNFLLVGNKMIINEYYGKGGYDPLDTNRDKSPERINYYN